ncbi:MarC family protein [Bradyrhizobium sp. LHD-71]|uniref:MarC family protein n=1 Tax=Bradyrhizobium sp. LHD-71 TaxID=3072141 RepID=UPI00280F8885|nr:MarC family protein [Bradyrhizobium sp. LHD-71]MDQ8729392.1 MarC family protein [Bradyrhizobium sp. LHD-71]
MEFATSSFVTLLLVIDPVGLVPAFISLTDGLDPRFKREVAFRSSIIAAGILILTALGGSWLLGQLKISVPAFQIAGGLLLFGVAFRMVFGTEPEHHAREAGEALKEHVTNIAAFPLAIPLMAGPGALTATLLLSGRADGEAEAFVTLIGVIVAVIAACTICFLAAGRISKLLGITGNIVLSRVLGVILAAFAIQFLIDGLKATF